MAKILKACLKRYRQHTLREYERVAEKFYLCDRCHEQILPGDRYRGIVTASSRRHFTVFHYHADGCPVDSDEEEEKMLQQLKEMEEREREAPPVEEALVA